MDLEDSDILVRVTAERTEPFSGHGPAPDADLVPHHVEIGTGDKILGHADAIIEVEHRMPPAAGYEYGLSGLLYALDPSCGWVGMSYPWKDVDEVVDRLVIFERDIVEVRALGDGLGCTWLEKNPTFPSRDNHIPCRCPKRVHVKTPEFACHTHKNRIRVHGRIRSRPSGSQKQPAVRRPPLLSNLRPSKQ